MMLHIPQVLNKHQVAELREQIQQQSVWIDGTHSAGPQAQKIKNNLQVDIQSNVYESVSHSVLNALQQNLLLRSAALPKHTLLPMFNCYQNQGNYGNHVDNSIQYSAKTGQMIRTDVSITVFLSEPDEYEGGNLEFDMRNQKDWEQDKKKAIHECTEIRPRGSIIVFPSFVWHRVAPVTKGTRYSLVVWNLGQPWR